MDIDWLSASEDDRKQLYVATRAVADANDLSVEDIIDAALGRKALMGTDYISTFRRGKIRRSYAKLIHAWIADNHLEIANNVAPDLFVLPNTDAWDSYIDEHGICGRLQIKRFTKDRLNLIQKVKDRASPDARLKLGEEFCFFLRTESNAHAIGFERHKGKWHVMPLGHNGSSSFQLQSDEPHFPIDGSGTIERLTEESDLNMHRFVFILAEDVNDLPQKPDIKDISQEAELHYIDVLFSA